MPETVDLDILNSWNDAGFKIRVTGTNFRVLLLGESPHKSEMFRKQIELIKLVKPNFVLHEFATIWYYDPNKDRDRWFPQNNRIVGENDDYDDLSGRDLDDLKVLASMQRFSIVGCDLGFEEQKRAWLEIAKANPTKYVILGKGTEFEDVECRKGRKNSLEY